MHRIATATLHPAFIQKVKDTGLTYAALGRMTGTSREFIRQVFTGQTQPTARFMAGIVASGLADSLDEIAVIVPTEPTSEAA